MHPQPHPSTETVALRRSAEERLRQQQPETAPARTEIDTQRLVHELQVHQIELEMQNEELQQTRDAMEVGLEKYSDLYDFAPVGYVTLDRAGTICEANLASTSLLGTERSRLIRRPFGSSVAIPDRPGFAAFLSRVFEVGGKQSCEVTLTLEGRPLVRVRITAAVAASGRECRAVIEDLTERKRVEEERLILNKLESTGILAGGIAHDFNNLLAVIVLNVDLARENTTPGTELARLLEAASKAAMTARGLTQQLITLATGGAPIRKPTRLPAVIRESVRPALSGSRVECEFSLPDDLWPAEVDEGQIGQVFRNVVLNAREAMSGGGRVSVRAENVVLRPHDHPSLPPGDYVRVSVADRGNGIASDVLPRVFDPYFSTKQRGNQQGMGLGLTICHTVVRKHRGAIAVQSEPGVGTTVDVYLPADPGLLLDVPTPLPKAQPRPGRILVMDDEESVRKAVGALLQRMGHEVELVAEGRDAIIVYETAQRLGRPFEAVILDLTIRTGMGGEETMRTLRRLDPAVKGIVMSGYTDDPVLLDPERHGFQAVLPKPFDSASLREVLARVLER